jgi:NAD-specific glutamate dehydrogenase
MLSKSCNFNEFLEKISDCEYPEMLLFANDEATAAERTIYKQKDSLGSEVAMYQEYAVALKSFIYFLRNGIQPSPIRKFDFQQFQDIRDNWQKLKYEC